MHRVSCCFPLATRSGGKKGSVTLTNSRYSKATFSVRARACTPHSLCTARMKNTFRSHHVPEVFSFLFLRSKKDKNLQFSLRHSPLNNSDRFFILSPSLSEMHFSYSTRNILSDKHGRLSSRLFLFLKASPLTLFYVSLRLCSPRHNISPQRSLRQRHRRIAQQPAHRVLGRRCSSSRFLTRKLFARSTYARYQLADPCNLSTRTAIPARSVRANGLPPFSCRRIVRRR